MTQKIIHGTVLVQGQRDHANTSTLQNGTYLSCSGKSGVLRRWNSKHQQGMKAVMMRLIWVTCHIPQKMTKNVKSWLSIFGSTKNYLMFCQNIYGINYWKKNTQKHLIPQEMMCHHCPGNVPLSDPVLITNKDKIRTNSRIVEGRSMQLFILRQSTVVDLLCFH
jgi:hypothetical protein